MTEVTNIIDCIKNKIRQFCSTHEAQESMKFVLELDNMLYSILGNQSVRYGKGLHTKHKHINYHQFFVDNIEDGDSVLDLGCGIGVVANTIAQKRPQATVTGIDMKSKNINTANKFYKRNNLSFFVGDILKIKLETVYNVCILSNVLEHLQGRVEFLEKIRKTLTPEKVLLRVPIFERDWKVPLKRELGVSYMLDPTHVVEYTQDEWIAEIKQAGFKINKFKICWGELRASLSPF